MCKTKRLFPAVYRPSPAGEDPRPLPAISQFANRIDRPMCGIVRDWLRPHLCRALEGQLPDDIPDEVEVHQQRPRWVRMRVELPLREYQAVRFAASRVDASCNLLLYAWVMPRLAELGADG